MKLVGSNGSGRNFLFLANSFLSPFLFPQGVAALLEDWMLYMKQHIPAHWISPFIGDLNKTRVSYSLLSVNSRGTRKLL
jgi:hypothetical protein